MNNISTQQITPMHAIIYSYSYFYKFNNNIILSRGFIDTTKSDIGLNSWLMWSNFNLYHKLLNVGGNVTGIYIMLV